MKAKHKGNFETCEFCQRYIQLAVRLDQDVAGYTSTTRRLHRQAIARQDKDQAYRDCGMVKVRGNLGGTYWE